MARDAVFGSWNNPRAITYRRLNDIPGNLGTAVNVQAMVFGNMGDTSATGRGFHPRSFDRRQGVLRRVPDERPGRGRRGGHPHAAPDRRPRQGNAAGIQAAPRDHEQAREALPRCAGFRIHGAGRQRSICSRPAPASARPTQRSRSRWTWSGERLISKEEAVLRVEPASLDQLLHPIIDPKAKIQVIAKGLPASPGAASGKVVFTADEAVRLAKKRQGHPRPARDHA